jgi:hypothetical protein
VFDLFLCNALGVLFRVLAWLLYLLALYVLAESTGEHALIVFLFGIGIHIWGLYLKFMSNHTVAIIKSR